VCVCVCVCVLHKSQSMYKNMQFLVHRDRNEVEQNRVHIEKSNIFLNAGSSHGILFYFYHNRIHNEFTVNSTHLRVRKISFVGQ